MADEPLRGWKEISSHLKTSPRTAQRWEALHGMPVRRMGAVVSAYPAELDEWRQELAALPAEDDAESDPNGTGQPDPSSEPRGQVAAVATSERRRFHVALTAMAVATVSLAVSAWGIWSWPAVRPESSGRTAPAPATVVLLRVKVGEGVPNTVGVRCGVAARIEVPNRPLVLLTPALSGDELDVRVETLESSGAPTFVGSLRLRRDVTARLGEPQPVEIAWVGVVAPRASGPGDRPGADSSTSI